MSWKWVFWKLYFYSISYKWQNIFLTKKKHHSQAYLLCWTGQKGWFCWLSFFFVNLPSSRKWCIQWHWFFCLLPTLPSNYIFLIYVEHFISLPLFSFPNATSLSFFIFFVRSKWYALSHSSTLSSLLSPSLLKNRCMSHVIIEEGD